MKLLAVDSRIKKKALGFFEPGTLAVFIDELCGIGRGEKPILFSTSVHERFHFFQTFMTTYGFESHWLSAMRTAFLLRVLKWLKEGGPKGSIPYPVEVWLKQQAVTDDAVKLFWKELLSLDMYAKTLHGFPALSIERWSESQRGLGLSPLMVVHEDDLQVLAPIGGILLAENWARSVQEQMFSFLCETKEISRRKAQKLFDRIRIGRKGESRESKLMRYAMYLSVAYYVKDAFDFKNWRFLFRFLADKALMIPMVSWGNNLGESLIETDPVSVFPGFRYKMLFAALEQNKDSLRTSIDHEDYQTLDEELSTILGWTTTTEVISKVLARTSEIEMPILRKLFNEGLKLRMEKPEILVEPLLYYRLLEERLPLPIHYTRDGWVGFSADYDESERSDLIFIFDMAKMTEAILYGEPCQCFYPQCPSRSTCNTWGNVLEGERATDCVLEKWANRHFGVDLAKMKPCENWSSD